MSVLRITCGTCASSTWDVELDAAKYKSFRRHKVYLRDVKDRNGQRIGEEDTDFNCPGCGEAKKLTAVQA